MSCIVQTQSGKVQGRQEEDGVAAFLGVPYAKPPVGPLRWQQTQPVEPWDGVRQCQEFSPIAPQPPIIPVWMWTEEFFPPLDSKFSEDCLYLNIWTNLIDVNHKKPVIVFLHGGSLKGGSGSVPVTLGHNMARSEHVVMVNVNYRVGYLGFFAHPELSRQSPNGVSGNQGLFDILEALRWVQSNICAFGGDPNNVTLSGQSAGGSATAYLLTSPLAKGLFHKACLLSGTASPTITSLALAEEAGVKYMADQRCECFADLLKLDAKQISSKAPRRWPVIVDGALVPRPVDQTYAEGKQHDVPLMFGWTRNDCDILKNVFGPGVRRLAHQATATGVTAPCFVYYFDRSVPSAHGQKNYGAFHSGDLPYFFGNLNQCPKRPWFDEDHKLSRIMCSAWAQFARTGDPNGPALPIIWPPFQSDHHINKPTLNNNQQSSITVESQTKHENIHETTKPLQLLLQEQVMVFALDVHLEPLNDRMK